MALYPTLRFPQIDSLISQFEGYGNTETAPSITSGYNPGAIMWGPYAQSYGATGANPNGTAVFPSYEAGVSALDNLVGQKIAAGANTPDSLAQSWAPATAPGNTSASTVAYAEYIARGLGIGVGDTIPQTSEAGSNSGQAGPWIPGASNTVQPGAITGSGAGGAGGGFWDWIDQQTTDWLPGYSAVKATGSALQTAAAVSWWQGLTLGQITILAVGLILLIAGLFSLRPVQAATTTIVSSVKKGTAALA